MRFQKTVYIDNDTYDALGRGEIKLQPGQWVQLAWLAGNPPSRWVGITPSGSYWIAHWSKWTKQADQFKVMNKNFKAMWDRTDSK